MGAAVQAGRGCYSEGGVGSMAGCAGGRGKAIQGRGGQRVGWVNTWAAVPPGRCTGKHGEWAGDGQAFWGRPGATAPCALTTGGGQRGQPTPQ